MGAASGQAVVDGRGPAACTVEVTDDAFVVAVDGGETMSIPYDDIADLADEDYTLRVTSADGRTVEVSMLGKAYGQIAAEAARRRDEVLERVLLLRGVGLQDTYPGTLLGDHAPEPVAATFRLYEDLLVVRPEHGAMLGVPYSFIEQVEFDPDLYQTRILADDGTTVVAGKLAKRSEEFADELRRLLAALDVRTADALRAMIPGAPGVERLAAIMRDGRAVQRRRVEAIDPGLWTALEAAVVGSRREHYEHLAARTPEGWAAIGVKQIGESDSESEPEEPAGAEASEAAEPDELPGGGVNRCWFFCPLAKNGEPVNAVASETTSETGVATYVFRLMEPERFASLSGEALADAVERSIGVLNRALLALSFRREPLYAPDEEIESGRFRKYRAAVRLLPYLRWARASLLGRVPHTGNWASKIDELIDRA